MILELGLEKENIRLRELIGGIKECLSGETGTESFCNAAIMYGQVKELIRFASEYDIKISKNERELKKLEEFVQSKMKLLYIMPS